MKLCVDVLQTVVPVSRQLLGGVYMDVLQTVVPVSRQLLGGVYMDVLQTVVPVSRQLLGGVYLEAGVQRWHLPDGRVLWRPYWDRLHPWPAQEDLPLLPVCANSCPKHRPRSRVGSLPAFRRDYDIFWFSLCRITFLPVTHILVATWQLTVMPVYKH